MTEEVRTFFTTEDGGITVDWVVLTAVVLGVLLGALTTFNQGAMDHAKLTSSTIDAQGIPGY